MPKISVLNPFYESRRLLIDFDKKTDFDATKV